MIKPPLFSVLIANFNNGRYLEEAINSILNQTYTNWEIIIVDDCSTDNSKQIYERLSKDLRIRVFFNEQNLGCGYTKMKCVEYAQGEVCGFLDPDDTLTLDALEKMVQHHVSKPECSLIHATYYRCDENLNIKIVSSQCVQIAQNDNFFFNDNGEISHFCTFKKSFYNTTDGIDPFLLRAVDQDLYLKLYDVGNTFYLDEPLYYYRIHKGGISTNDNARKAFYWNWMVICSTVRRRKLNFEDEFFHRFVPKAEYDYLMNEYNKLVKYRKINKVIQKLKSFLN